MVKKIGSKKIGKVQGSEIAKEIQKTDSVGKAEAIRATGAVRGATASQSARGRKGTRLMSLAEREELFRMVTEEAERMFPEGTVPAEQKEIIAGAVKMAIDSGLIEEEEEEKQQD